MHNSHVYFYQFILCNIYAADMNELYNKLGVK